MTGAIAAAMAAISGGVTASAATTGMGGAATTGAGGGAGEGASTTGVAGSGSATGSGAASRTKSAKAAMSSSSSTVTMIGTPTTMSSAPESIRILAAMQYNTMQLRQTDSCMRQ